MKIQKPKTFYFNPPLLNVKAIQLCEMWVNNGTYLIFCDAIDTGFSLANFNNDDNLMKPNPLIGLHPRGLGQLFKTNKTMVSKLTITIKNTDLTEPINDVGAILNLKTYHD